MLWKVLPAGRMTGRAMRGNRGESLLHLSGAPEFFDNVPRNEVTLLATGTQSVSNRWGQKLLLIDVSTGFDYFIRPG